MEWHDSGIIISNSKYNDKTLIIACLTETHGVRSGLINKSKNNNNITLGNKVEITWRGRLENHLGRFTINSYTPIYQHIFHDYTRLNAVLSTCSLISISVLEKEKQERLYVKLSNLLDTITSNNPAWINSLIKLELYILSITGFGLELDKCTVTETTHNLKYISPKTGKAVSSEIGKQYEDKLFPLLDVFIKHKNYVDLKESIQAFGILTHFLEKHILPLKNSTMPQYRTELLETLKRQQINIE
jgi:DNA repair protein RecO (recombination protein O)